MMRLWVFLAAILVVVGIGFVTGAWYELGTGGSAVVTIEDTEVKGYQEGDRFVQKYLVFTDHGVFENTDSFWRMKFNSSDMHGGFKKLKDHTVKIHYYGWRIPFFSSYPNIYKVEPVE